MNRLRRSGPLLLTLAALIVLAGVALLAPPPEHDDGPGGTSALRRFLDRRGVEVESSDAPGSTDEVFFLPHDLRSARQAAPILEWVEDGGRVVVSDPGSGVLRSLGIRRGGDVGGILPGQRLARDCLVAETAGVSSIRAVALDAMYAPGPAAAVGCFQRPGGSYLVHVRHGAGEVIALGGLTPLTNRFIDEEDDVRLAWNLLGSGAGVVVGTPLPAAASRPSGLWDLLPDAAKAVVIQLALAAILFAIARGRRLGRAVPEAAPSPIPAAELVTATADLYRRARAAPHGARVLRERFLGRAGRRLGVPPGAPPERVVDATAAATGVAREHVLAALADAGDERQLIEVARGIETLERRIEGEAGWHE